MAKNENTFLPPQHQLFLAKTGYGKSQTFKRRSGIPARGQRVVLWDNNKDHDAHRYKDMGGFFRALSKADKSGRGFRIAYVGEAAPEIFEIWARGVWSILDGRKMTHIVVEEYSDCCAHPGGLSVQRDRYHRRLWTQSRKYGGIIYATSQRPQLISKDALDNAAVIWASHMGFKAAKRVSEEIDVSPQAIRACTPGEFYHWQNSGAAEKIRVFHPKH